MDIGTGLIGKLLNNMKVKVIKDGTYQLIERNVDRVEIETDRGTFLVMQNREGIDIRKNGKESITIIPDHPNRIVVD